MELLEREHHLDQLEEHLRSAASGHGRIVMVGGEAGVGKTSLMVRFRTDLDGRAAIFSAACDALPTPTPLGPVRDLAPMLGIRVAPDAESGHGQDTLFRSVLGALRDRTPPAVAIIEDAHWADGATLDLVRFLPAELASTESC